MNSVTNSMKDCPFSGINFNSLVVLKLITIIISITIHELISTCPCTRYERIDQ